MKKELAELSVFILAGGLGTRLRPAVSDRPKAMALIDQVPFVEILITSPAVKGLRNFVLLLGYMSEQIEDYFATNKPPELNVEISRESEPLGTGGAVKNALKFASDPTILINGDTFFDADLSGLFRVHSAANPAVTLSLRSVPDVSRYGQVILDSEGVVTGFLEKNAVHCGPGYINAGFSMLSLEFIKSLPDGRFSMEQDVFPGLVPTRKMIGYKQDKAFFDIGTPESYAEFQAWYKKRNRSPGRI